ncbi:hypothetical protein CYY_007391 [Polysphondylium violaceum]|uniref:Major facilitator superfamily (MFS) profile domain-containing protein n=1 Tax=Polysphondylium violaceum TaxID=133409 RepID=A0A8J4PRY1_9MYCE|nr:hypothetical protein CYY_007391 [Polysphondylium violaceum]
MELYENDNLFENDQQYLLSDSYQIVGSKTPRRYWIGLIVILLSNISLSIVSVAIWPYLHINGLTISILAIALASFHSGSSIGRKFFSYYIEKTKSYWLLLVTSLVVTFIGDVVYASYPHISSIVISRFIVGFGTGSQVVLQNLLSDSTDSILLKYRVSKITLFTSIAYVLGPALVAALSTIDIPYHLSTSTQVERYNYFNGITLIGWIAAFLTLISIGLALLGKLLDNSITKHYETTNTDESLVRNNNNIINNNNTTTFPYKSQKSCIFPPKVTIFIFCFSHFLIFNAGMILEMIFIPYIIDLGGMSSYNWSLTKISLFFMGLGISCMIASTVSKKIQNQEYLLMGSILLVIVGYCLMILWNLPTFSVASNHQSPQIFRFLLGVVFVAIGFPIAVSSSIKMFFDLFASIHPAYSNVVFQFSTNLGRLTGPIWTALIVSNIGPNNVFFFGFIISLTSLILLLTLKKSTKYISSVTNIQRNVPIISDDDTDNYKF